VETVTLAIIIFAIIYVSLDVSRAYYMDRKYKEILSMLKLIAARMEPDEEDEIDGETGGPVTSIPPENLRALGEAFGLEWPHGHPTDRDPSLGFPPPESR
jgi:hypothetical protein